MRTKKLRVAAFALSLGLLVGDFGGGISQIHAAEVSDPFLGNDSWMGMTQCSEKIKLIILLMCRL